MGVQLQKLFYPGGIYARNPSFILCCLEKYQCLLSPLTTHISPLLCEGKDWGAKMPSHNIIGVRKTQKTLETGWLGSGALA